MVLDRLKRWKNRRAFQRARREADRSGQMVCAVLKDGKPVYFPMPKGAPDEAIQAKAFEIVEGRPLSQAEEILRRMAQAGSVKAAQ